MNKKLQLSVPLILIFPLMFAFPAFGNTALKNFQIPSQLGTVKEVFEVPDPGEPLPAIIQIQDAHCNYEAQKNLAGILDYLAREKKLKLIMVEGGSGDVGLSFLRDFADKASRERVADKYLREGKISGEEYLDIVSDHNLELYGIEDPALYDSNLDSFLNIEAYKEQGLSDLENLKAVAEALKPHIYGAQLKQLDDKKASFEKKELPLADYCTYLKGAASHKGVRYDSYSQLKNFLESFEIEKTIDFKKAETQRSAFIQGLAQKLQGEAVKDLIARTQAFKDRNISAAEFYEFLRTAAQNNPELSASYPEFEAYMRYVSLGRNIDAEKLIKEMHDFESSVRESLFVNNDERRLSSISSAIDILTQFLKLDLTPAEYSAMQADRQNYTTASWINFLTDACRRYNVALRPQASALIDQDFDTLDGFYKVGIEREKAFMQNISQKISRSGDNNYVVVITGGFHTSGLSRLFKESGYSYAVVTPGISKKSDPEIYYSVLRGEDDRDDATVDSDSVRDDY